MIAVKRNIRAKNDEKIKEFVFIYLHSFIIVNIC